MEHTKPAVVCLCLAFAGTLIGAQAAGAPARPQPSAPVRALQTPVIADFRLTGTSWTCTTDGGLLTGVLLLPEGNGPFPAIVLSHGLGGNAEGISRAKGREIVRWGFVCIATDYTHAGTEPRGRRTGRRGYPNVDFSQAGARPENIRRALACLEILRQRPDVDRRRIAAYGHSMGAFVTIALAAAAPDRLTAAAITAGGINTATYRRASAPSADVAARVRTPFLILQGADDTTVTPESSARFKEVLDQNRIANERHLFEGIGHNLPNPSNAHEVYRLMRGWFSKRGVVDAEGSTEAGP